MPGANPNRESAKAATAYADFLALGDDRQIKHLHAAYKDRHARGESVPTTSYARLREWSSVYKWRDRIEAHLAGQRKKQEAAEGAKWAQRREQMRESEIKTADALLAQAHEMLEWPIAEAQVRRSEDGTAITVLVPAKWTKADAARMVDVATKIRRLAVGEPTQHTQVTGKLRVSEVIAEIPLETLDSLEDEKGKGDNDGDEDEERDDSDSEE